MSDRLFTVKLIEPFVVTQRTPRKLQRYYCLFPYFFSKAPNTVTFMKGRRRYFKASVTIMADFSPEFNPPVRWRSKHKTKNDR